MSGARRSQPAASVQYLPRRTDQEPLIELDPATVPWQDAYGLMTASVVPRPIAWVSTISATGVRNIAPFSFFNAFCANPVILGFAPMAASDRERKDTLANIEALGEFVINIATEARLESMDVTGRAWAAEADEFEIAGLTAVPSAVVAPPRIAEAPINFECVTHQLVALGAGLGSATLVLGRAVRVHVDDSVLRDGRVDPALLQPVARMGGPFYARPALLGYQRADRT